MFVIQLARQSECLQGIELVNYQNMSVRVNKIEKLLCPFSKFCLINMVAPKMCQYLREKLWKPTTHVVIDISPHMTTSITYLVTRSGGSISFRELCPV